MSRKLPLYIMSFFLIIYAVPSGICQTPFDQREAEGEAAHEIMIDEEMAETEMQGSMDGKVTIVNAASDTFIVKDTEYDNQSYVFAVNRDTTFTGAGSLKDVNPGDQVDVDYIVLGGRMIADSVDVEESDHPESSVPGAGLENPLVDMESSASGKAREAAIDKDLSAQSSDGLEKALVD